MFLANIAFALYLIALVFGTFLISWGVYKGEKCAAMGAEGMKKGRCATGFAKVIGIIVFILAIIGLICTITCAVKMKHFMHEKREMMEQNIDNTNSNQTPANTSSPD